MRIVRRILLFSVCPGKRARVIPEPDPEPIWVTITSLEEVEVAKQRKRAEEGVLGDPRDPLAILVRTGCGHS